MVSDTRAAGVDLGARHMLRTHFFVGCGFDKGRTTEEDRTRRLDYDDLVAHGREVRSSCRATSHHRGDLGYAFRAHLRLIVEDASEVFPIGEDFILQRQESTP